MSLYSRLLKYQSTNVKSNLENFLTEMLCDYLNRITENELLSFMKEVLFFNNSKSWIDNQFITNQEIIWKTQYSINWQGTIKYPDLICLCNKKPCLLVENKIGAQFTQRILTNEQNEKISVGQLQDYGTWLNSINQNGAMVLLTNFTDPPNDFLQPTSNYGVRTRNVIGWQQVYDWLRNLRKNSNNVLCITNDFISFLEEQGMANESPSHSDFSILELFIGGPRMRIGNALKNTREGLQKKYQQRINWGVEKSYFNDYLYSVDDEGKIVWSWTILDHSEYSYMGWGFIFPDERDIWDLRKSFVILPKEPFAFMLIYSEGEKVKKNFKEKLKIRPENWLWTQDMDISNRLGLVCAPLSGFLAYDVDFNKAFFEWVNKHFDLALSFFKSLIDANDK